MKKPLLIGALILLGLCVAAGAGWVFAGKAWYDRYQEHAALNVLREDPRTAEIVERIEANEKRVEEDPKNVEYLLSLANGWKEAFDMTADARHVNRAIAAYEEARWLSEGRNSTVVANLATAWRLAHRPERAEQVLREGIEAAPGDPALYLLLVNVLRDDLHRDNTEIIDVYRLGLDHLVSNAALMQSLAAYLEDAGRPRDALTYYKLLAAKYPQFEDKVREIERRLSENP